MIDDPIATADLMAKLKAALPIPARLTPELQLSLGGQITISAVPATATVTLLYDMGDEGGILCKLDFGSSLQDAAFVSITHLRFDPRLPLAREIKIYQKRRVKRLRRQSL